MGAGLVQIGCQVVARLQADPTRWGKMIRMENAICEASTSGDRGGLVKTLSEYRMFFDQENSACGDEDFPLFDRANRK